MRKEANGVPVGRRYAPYVDHVRASLLASILAWISACGGGGNRVTTPQATPTPGPILSVVAQGNFTISAPDEEASYFVRRAIITSVAGTLETTVDWTYPTDTLWMYLAEGACTADQFASEDCPGSACPCRFSVTSQRDDPKPRVLTVTGASAGTRTLFVWNRGPQEEAGTYQALLTTAGTALRATALQDIGVEMARKPAAHRHRAGGQANTTHP